MSSETNIDFPPHDRALPTGPKGGRRDDRLLRLKEVKHRTGLSRSSIYAKMASASFPLSIKLGARMVAWYQSQVDDWIVNPQ